jgi:hypothetical protein
MKLGTSTVVPLAFAFNLAWYPRTMVSPVRKEECVTVCKYICDTASMTLADSWKGVRACSRAIAFESDWWRCGTGASF